MPPRPVKKNDFGDYLTIYWKRSAKFPNGSISVTKRSNLVDGNLKFQNLLNKKVMVYAEGTPMQATVAYQGYRFLLPNTNVCNK